MMGVKVKIDMNTNKTVLKMMMMMTVMTEHDSVATMVVMAMAIGDGPYKKSTFSMGGYKFCKKQLTLGERCASHLSKP